jgi:hypothetical protein
MDGLPSYFSLREEARKSWDYFITDKLIYAKQLIDSEDNPFLFISEVNLYREPWIEGHFVFGGKWKSHYVFIAEGIPGRDWNAVRDGQINMNGMPSQIPVLVDVPQLIEPPEMATLVGIPVMVRLKRLHDGDCEVGDLKGAPSNPDLCVERILFADWEARFPRRLIGSERSQLPCHVIEGGSQTGDEIASDQRNDGVGKIYRRSDNPLIPFNVVCGREMMGIRCPVFADLNIERVKVFLRPTHFTIGLYKTGHNDSC